jgi:hypothetical protein
MSSNASTIIAPELVTLTERTASKRQPEEPAHPPAADAALDQHHDLDREAVPVTSLQVARQEAVGRLTGALQREKAARQRAEHELRWYREHLEELVGQRTAEFQAANARLVESAARRDEAAKAEEHYLLARHHLDEVLQTLFAANLIAEALPEALGQAPERARRGADELRKLTRSALAELRTLWTRASEARSHFSWAASDTPSVDETAGGPSGPRRWALVPAKPMIRPRRKLRKLKKQYGKYTTVATPRAADI